MDFINNFLEYSAFIEKMRNDSFYIAHTFSAMADEKVGEDVVHAYCDIMEVVGECSKDKDVTKRVTDIVAVYPVLLKLTMVQMEADGISFDEAKSQTNELREKLGLRPLELNPYE